MEKRPENLLILLKRWSPITGRKTKSAITAEQSIEVSDIISLTLYM